VAGLVQSGSFAAGRFERKWLRGAQGCPDMEIRHLFVDGTTASGSLVALRIDDVNRFAQEQALRRDH
jgi:hypothetical protein